MNLHEDKDKDKDKDESNKTKVIMDKKDYKMTRIDKYNYLFEYEIINNRILLEKVIKDISKEKYENIIKGTYNRTKKYSKKPSNRRKTLKNYL
jgi:hypothetical protein